MYYNLSERNDLHIHTNFSCDSTEIAERYVKKAISRNYKNIAFTDHFEFLPEIISVCGIPNLQRYYQEIDRLNRKYPEINIIFGAEIGDYHRCKDYADEVFSYLEPNLKIASVHNVNGLEISTPFKEKITKELIYDYYQENLDLVQSCDFDILGHLGIYKRYLNEEPDESHCSGLKEQIFKTIIEKDIALEVNYSSLFKNFGKLMISANDFKMFKKLGGKKISIGSDSHSVKQFDEKYDQMLIFLKNLKLV